MPYPYLFVNARNRVAYLQRITEAALENEKNAKQQRRLSPVKRMRHLKAAADDLKKGFEAALRLYEHAELTRDMTDMEHAVPYVDYRIQMAYLVAVRAYGDVKDTLFALLAAAVRPLRGVRRVHRIDATELEELFGPDYAPLEAMREQSSVSDEEIDTAVLTACRERLVARINRTVIRNHAKENMPLLRTTLETACRWHGACMGPLREPSFLHLLHVCDLLAESHMPYEVVIAALLHAVPVPAKGKEAFLAEACGGMDAHVRTMVEACLEIERLVDPTADLSCQEAYLRLRQLLSDFPEDRKRILAIKTADLICRIGDLPDPERDTGNPLADTLAPAYVTLLEECSLPYLCNRLKSACMRFTNGRRYHKIARDYADLLSRCELQLMGFDYREEDDHTTRVPGFRERLRLYVNRLRRSLSPQAKADVECVSVPYTVHEISEQLMATDPYGASSADVVISKRNVTLERMFAVLPPEVSAVDFFHAFVREFYTDDVMQDSGTREERCKRCFIRAIEREEEPLRYRVTVEDDLYNRIEVVLTDRTGYLTALYGDTVRAKAAGRARDTILVEKPDGSMLELEAGATVLDCAYYIHTELCLQACEAIVNGRRRRLDAVLSEGDRVYICKHPGEVPGTPTPPAIRRINVNYMQYTKNPEVQRFVFNSLVSGLQKAERAGESTVTNEEYERHLEFLYHSTPALHTDPKEVNV